MNANQQLKLELIKEFKGSTNMMELCRLAYDFIMDSKEENPELKSFVNTENGIYLIFSNGQYSLYYEGMSKSLAGDVTCIGVVYDGHAFKVALEGLGNLPLIEDANNTCPPRSPFYKTECEGLHDWDFVGATNHLKECGMNMLLPRGWYIPTLAVLEVMCFLKREIDAAIKFAGGKPLSEDYRYHWSSTELDCDYARDMDFENGFAKFNPRNNSLAVRPVAAFNLEA